MKYIQNLTEGEDVNEVYLCKAASIREKKNGDEYLDFKIADKTGEMDAKAWDLNAGVEDIEPGMYIRVSGKVQSYKDMLQLRATGVKRCKEGEYIEADYVPTSNYSIDNMFNALLNYIESVKQPHLHALLEEFFVKDTEFVSIFKKSSAAKVMHHAFLGGLLEHTMSVAHNCKFFAEKYKILNYDLIITAALLHDIGKTRELTAFPINDYSDEGNLLGHIVMGVMMVNEKVVNIPDFPKLLLDELNHCILAHHGELEFGSPKKPELAEAMALNFADNLDAKMQTLLELFNSNASNAGADWMGFQKSFDSNIRRTKV